VSSWRNGGDAPLDMGEGLPDPSELGQGAPFRGGLNEGGQEGGGKKVLELEVVCGWSKKEEGRFVVGGCMIRGL